MVDLLEFATAVSKMRRVQQDYFRRRMPKLLDQAKAEEAVVDGMLKKLAPSNVSIANDMAHQTTLFG